MVYQHAAPYGIAGAEVGRLGDGGEKLFDGLVSGPGALVVLLGLVFPATVVIISLNTGIENMTSILYATIFCELLGDITMRYLILKDGLYSPLIPSAAYPTV